MVFNVKQTSLISKVINSFSVEFILHSNLNSSLPLNILNRSAVLSCKLRASPGIIQALSEHKGGVALTAQLSVGNAAQLPHNTYQPSETNTRQSFKPANFTYCSSTLSISKQTLSGPNGSLLGWLVARVGSTVVVRHIVLTVSHLIVLLYNPNFQP